MNEPSLARRLVAEMTGTALLLATVVGSGIMGEQLAGGNVAIALLANTLATGAVLVALILTFGAISGAHFNPAVTFADAAQGGITWREALAYFVAQMAGALLGVLAAHVMFGKPLVLPVATRSGRRPQCSAKSSPRSGCSRSSGAARGAARRPCRSPSARISRPRTGSRRPLVREPRRHDRAGAERHLRRHPPGRRPRLRYRASHRRHGRNRAVPVARAAGSRDG